MPRVTFAFFLVPEQQVRNAERDERPVERPARPEALDQAEETLPRRGVGLAIAFLGGVASRGIEQHRIIGEPPVAIARSAHTRQRRVATHRLQRKMQTCVDQSGGLSRTRRSYE